MGHLNHNALVDDLLDQIRVLVQRESMADTAGVEEHRVVKVVVRRVAIIQRLPGMEEVRDLKVESLSLLAEPDEFGGEVNEGTAQVFLRDKVVAAKEIREILLALEGYLHASSDSGSVLDPGV